MGEHIENIHDSTIYNRSKFENSFNKVERERGQDVSQALKQVAEFIQKSGDPAAQALFDSFREELNNSKPEKSKLRNFWEGLEKVLPSIATISGSVAKIVTLYSG